MTRTATTTATIVNFINTSRLEIAIIIISCVVVILCVNAAYVLGKRRGNGQYVGNVSNSTVNQSNGGIALIQLQRYVLRPTAMDSDGKALWRKELEKEASKQIGLECYKKGLVSFNYEKGDYYPERYDLMTATLNIKEERK